MAGYKELRGKMTPHVEQLRRPNNSASERSRLAQAISGAASTHLDSLFANFKAYCVRDTSDAENPG